MLWCIVLKWGALLCCAVCKRCVVLYVVLGATCVVIGMCCVALCCVVLGCVVLGCDVLVFRCIVCRAVLRCVVGWVLGVALLCCVVCETLRVVLCCVVLCEIVLWCVAL